jgi:1,4-alpha-glucan branching enzyme
VEGGVCKFSESYLDMGCHVGADNTFVCRQWIPGAQEAWLFGDFNSWNKYQFPLKKLPHGKWEVTLKPDEKTGKCRIPHLSKIKLAIKTGSGEVVDRYTCFTITD